MRYTVSCNSAQVLTGAGEDRVEHFGRDPSGEGVLLAWVVAAKQQEWRDLLSRVANLDGGAVRECRARPRCFPAGGDQRRPKRLPGEATEAYDHPQRRRHQGQLGGEPRGTIVTLLRCRLIVRRSA